MTAETPKKTWLIHDPTTIYYLHPSEHVGNALTKYLLKSANYEIWEKAICYAFGGRGKAVFLSPKVVPKPKDERELGTWESNNSIIYSWIFNSVGESIQPSIVSHIIAFELWSDLKKRDSANNFWSAQSLAIDTPGISTSPLLPEIYSLDGTHTNVSTSISGKSTIEQCLERLVNAVRKVSAKALNSSVSDMSSVISMMDRIAGSTPVKINYALIEEIKAINQQLIDTMVEISDELVMN
ncbi:unnamed protein product [Cuscuta campestris]|uniref:Retrotransposon Copia-like N-terminal domain-containing protein n=1 Tax=Cuscuta campestris TaxID=132261 RepID=A0A484K8H6_9ASTE|nr:unnamed protein product [Cuscuta campestris]